MTSQQLIAHFDRISEAHDAIPRLRRFIIDLAVRGRLVQQDANDEPASELLTRIQRHKTKLATSRKVKTPTSLFAPVVIERPFELPPNWSWAKWESITLKIGDIDHKMPETAADGVPFISPRDFLPDNRIDFDNAKRVSFADFSRLSRKMKAEVGDLIYPRYGTIGETRLVTDQRDFLVSYSCAVIKLLHDFIDPKYQYFFSLSTYCKQQARDAENKTTQANVGIKSIQDFILPIPPLAEQCRIVAKVDELMALCKQLEMAWTEREKRRDRFVAAANHHLRNGGNAEEFKEHAKFVFTHLPRLTATAEHIQHLRQTVLSLAVRGKLVAQDPNDDPPAPPLKPRESRFEEAPFDIPTSWRWMAVCQVGEARLGKMLDKAKNKGTPCRYLRNVNVRWFNFDLTDIFEMPFEHSELDEFALRAGDVLICEGGEPGRAAVWDDRETGIYFQKAIHRVRFSKWVDPNYFSNALRESADSGRLSAYFTGVGIKHLTGKGLASFVFPVPPLAEQRRIIGKIKELMAVCERLEVQLSLTRQVSRQVLEAILAKALSELSLQTNPEADSGQLAC